MPGCAHRSHAEMLGELASELAPSSRGQTAFRDAAAFQFAHPRRQDPVQLLQTDAELLEAQFAVFVRVQTVEDGPRIEHRGAWQRCPSAWPSGDLVAARPSAGGAGPPTISVPPLMTTVPPLITKLPLTTNVSGEPSRLRAADGTSGPRSGPPPVDGPPVRLRRGQCRGATANSAHRHASVAIRPSWPSSLSPLSVSVPLPVLVRPPPDLSRRGPSRWALTAAIKSAFVSLPP